LVAMGHGAMAVINPRSRAVSTGMLEPDKMLPKSMISHRQGFAG
jgi:hypothetical protein